MEEALNTIDEIMIMKKIYPNYEASNNYVRLTNYIWSMIGENTEFLNKIRQSQFTGNSDWEDYLGNDMSKSLIALCDKHYDIMVNRTFELISNENLLEELEKVEMELISIIDYANEIFDKRIL